MRTYKPKGLVRKNICSICKKELIAKPTRIVQQQYLKKPYGRYITIETWDLCIECYKDILEETKRRSNDS